MSDNQLKKRVIQLVGSFHLGGSERQAIGLTRSLLNDGTYEVSMATLSNQGVLLGDVESLGLGEVREYPLTSFYNLEFVRQVRRFARFMADNRIDLLQTHDFYTNVFGMSAASLAGIKAKVAAKRETLGVRSPAQEFVEKLAFGRADSIVVNAAAVREYLIERSVPAGKITVIYNGLDISRFDDETRSPAEVRLDLGLPAEGPLVTLVANLRHPVKDVPMFLRSAQKVTQAIGGVQFVVAGEGELEGELKTLATELNIADRVHFIGRCSDVPGLLSVASVCVLTSVAEGFSNSIIEYMAAGRPVVATNVGGAAEAIADGVTGYLVEPGDDGAMAGHVIELLKDNEKAEKMGKTGKIMVAGQFSTSAQLSKTLQLYDHCLSK